MTGTPEILGIPTANLALLLSVLSLVISPFWVALWVARRDRADVRVELRYADVFNPAKVAHRFLIITAANKGRRPVKLNVYGLEFSDHSSVVFVPCPTTPLPKKLEEGESYVGFMSVRSAQECVRSKSARLTALCFLTEDWRMIRLRIRPWSRWHKRLREGPLVPEPTSEEIFDPLGPLFGFFRPESPQG